jgi:Putative beta barrel porin-7 (BBP7)
MKKIGIFLAVLASVVVFTSSANASFSACQSIADPMQRLACYDKAAKATAPSGKIAAVNPVEGTTSNTIPAKPIVKALSPAASDPRYWVEAEGGIYGFSKNLPVLAVTAPPGTAGPTPIPTAPGFIGLFSVSTVTNPLTTGAPADVGGGGSYRMGYWLDPARTMAVEGSVFFVQGNSRFDLSQAPTTVKTSTFVNTTPDVFVGLFDDTTTTTLTNGTISDLLYGADANFRVRAPHFANLSSFDVMFGMRYVALDEKLAASVNSLFSRTFQPALGLPPTVDFSNSLSGSDLFKIRNDFIGPQIGFNAEQHWGPFWVANENKVAVGAMIEQLSVSGSSVSSTTPTTTLALAGIPLTVNAGTPPVTGAGAGPSFGLFAQGDRSKTVFAVLPSGNIKVGYDIIGDMLSLTLAYNYLYMSSVGRVGDQIASSDIRQSSFFAQGVTLGVKAKF